MARNVASFSGLVESIRTATGTRPTFLFMKALSLASGLWRVRPERIFVGIDRNRRSDPPQRDRLSHGGGKAFAHTEQRRLLIQREDEMHEGLVRIACRGSNSAPSEISAN